MHGDAGLDAGIRAQDPPSCQRRHRQSSLSASSPLHVAKLAVRAVLPGTQDRRPHPVPGTVTKEYCEQWGSSGYCRHSPVLGPSPSPQLSRVLLVPSLVPILWPLPPPSATEPGHRPTLSASQAVSYPVVDLRSAFFWHAAKQLFPHGLPATCSVLFRVVQSLVPAPLQPLLSSVRGPVFLLPPHSPPAAASPEQPPSLLSLPLMAGHTQASAQHHRCDQASRSHVHALLSPGSLILFLSM